MRWSEAQASARQGVLYFEPRERQRLFISDLDGERHLFAEEGSGLLQRTGVAEADETVALPHARHCCDQQQDEGDDKQLRLFEQEAGDQHAADQVQPHLALHERTVSSTGTGTDAIISLSMSVAPLPRRRDWALVIKR